jgi:hypothetical protein
VCKIGLKMAENALPNSKSNYFFLLGWYSSVYNKISVIELSKALSKFNRQLPIW